MTEMPESARLLLEALVDIEEHATAVARAGGCECSEPVPEVKGRHYPLASFNSEKNIGKPFNQIVWEMKHQEGCPMTGQRGVGKVTYGGS